MGREGRVHDRKRARVMVRFGVSGPEKTAFTMNVSLSGAFIRTNSVFRPGTTIHVELELPQQSYGHWAQVVWAKKVPPELAHSLPCGMGVRFINPGSDWQKTFEAWKASKGGD
jgi:Tfp pilus assembly protein PilZ